MKCFQKQIDRNVCSSTYGKINHVEVPCPAGIICIQDIFSIIVDKQEINYDIVNEYLNSLSVDTLMDTISINHYCIDGVTVFATENIKILSDGKGGYYTRTINITATGLSC